MGVIGRNNGASRIVGFMVSGEEVERGMRMRDMEEEDILSRKTMERASSLKESLVVDVSGVIEEEVVSGRGGQL